MRMGMDGLWLKRKLTEIFRNDSKGCFEYVAMSIGFTE